MSWEIVGRFAGKGTMKKTVTVFRDSKGWRVYLPSSIRTKLGQPKLIDLYVDGYKIMLKVPEKNEVYTRHLTNGSVRLPLVKLGITIEDGITRLDILPQIRKDELVIDLGQYKSI